MEIPEYDVPTHTGFKYPVEKVFPAWKTPMEHKTVQASIAVYQELFGKPPEVDRWTFSTNGIAIAGVHGIPATRVILVLAQTRI